MDGIGGQQGRVSQMEWSHKNPCPFFTFVQQDTWWYLHAHRRENYSHQNYRVREGPIFWPLVL
jgi:hypothetical protein